MISVNYSLTRYDADEGKVFDWKEPRYEELYENDVVIDTVQSHLNVKTLFLGHTDSITNYVEVDANDINENSRFIEDLGFNSYVFIPRTQRKGR